MRVSSSLVFLSLYFLFAAAAVIPNVGDIDSRDNAGSQGAISKFTDVLSLKADHCTKGHISVSVRAIGDSGYVGRGLAGVVKPAVEFLQPTFTGLGQGVQTGAGNVKAAMQNAGAGLQQVTNAGAKIVGNTLVGAGGTVSKIPTAVYKTSKTIDNSPGVVGSVDRTILGQ